MPRPGGGRPPDGKIAEHAQGKEHPAGRAIAVAEAQRRARERVGAAATAEHVEAALAEVRAERGRVPRSG